MGAPDGVDRKGADNLDMRCVEGFIPTFTDFPIDGTKAGDPRPFIMIACMMQIISGHRQSCKNFFLAMKFKKIVDID